MFVAPATAVHLVIIIATALSAAVLAGVVARCRAAAAAAPAGGQPCRAAARSRRFSPQRSDAGAGRGRDDGARLCRAAGAVAPPHPQRAGGPVRDGPQPRLCRRSGVGCRDRARRHGGTAGADLSAAGGCGVAGDPRDIAGVLRTRLRRDPGGARRGDRHPGAKLADAPEFCCPLLFSAASSAGRSATVSGPAVSPCSRSGCLPPPVFSPSPRPLASLAADDEPARQLVNAAPLTSDGDGADNAEYHHAASTASQRCAPAICRDDTIGPSVWLSTTS